MRRVVSFPDKILRVKTEVISSLDEEILGEIKELEKVLSNSRERAAGLAAPQLGMSRRFFGMFADDKRKVRIVINPKITRYYGEKVLPMMMFEDGGYETFLEGCMSFPDLFGEVKRYLKIEAEWEEIEEGKLVKKGGVMEGVGAIVFQHEGEHLDGILFVDHIKEEGGKLYLWKGKEKVKADVNEILAREK